MAFVDLISKFKNDYFNCTIPYIEVRIGENKFETNEKIKLTNFEVSSTVFGESGVCSVQWATNIELSSFGKFNINNQFGNAKIGVSLTINAGYQNDSGNKKYSTIFEGFIFSTSIRIQDGISYLEVSGMDAKVWLMSNKVTMFSTEKQKYSDIVNKIFKKYSSKFKGSNINIKNEPQSSVLEMHQQNESDFDFLERISKRTGSLFYVLNGKFIFTSIGSNDSSLSISSDNIGINEIIKSVNFTSNLVSIPKDSSVSFTDGKNYKTSNVIKKSPEGKIGKKKTASSLTSNISENNTINILNNEIYSSEEASFIANAENARKSLNFVKLEIICKFFPDAEIGASVTVNGFDFPIDNDYILSSLNHKFNSSDGTYMTSITLNSDSFTPKNGGLGGLNVFSSLF